MKPKGQDSTVINASDSASVLAMSQKNPGVILHFQLVIKDNYHF